MFHNFWCNMDIISSLTNLSMSIILWYIYILFYFNIWLYMTFAYNIREYSFLRYSFCKNYRVFSYLYAEIKRFRPTFHTRRETNSILSVLKSLHCVSLTLSILHIQHVHICIKREQSLTPTQDVCMLRGSAWYWKDDENV